MEARAIYIYASLATTAGHEAHTTLVELTIAAWPRGILHTHVVWPISGSATTPHNQCTGFEVDFTKIHQIKGFLLDFFKNCPIKGLSRYLEKKNLIQDFLKVKGPRGYPDNGEFWIVTKSHEIWKKRFFYQLFNIIQQQKNGLHFLFFF